MEQAAVCVCFENLNNGKPLYVGVSEDGYSCQHVLHLDCWIRRLESADTRADNPHFGFYERVYPNCPYCRFEVAALYPWNEPGTIRLVEVTWGCSRSRHTDKVHVVETLEDVSAFDDVPLPALLPIQPISDGTVALVNSSEDEAEEESNQNPSMLNTEDDDGRRWSTFRQLSGRSRYLRMRGRVGVVEANVTTPYTVESPSNITPSETQEEDGDSFAEVVVTTITTTTTTTTRHATNPSIIIRSNASTAGQTSTSTQTQRTTQRDSDRNPEFDCSRCGCRYRQRQALRRHVRTIHEGHNLTCLRCNARFIGRDNLQRHMQQSH